MRGLTPLELALFGATDPSAGPDLTQARALARECIFSVEQCERVLVVSKRDEALARKLLHMATWIGGPNPIGEVCSAIVRIVLETAE